MHAYVSTSKVKLCDEQGRMHELEEVDPILASEIGRDVEMFVRVAGVDWRQNEALRAAVEKRGLHRGMNTDRERFEDRSARNDR